MEEVDQIIPFVNDLAVRLKQLEDQNAALRAALKELL